MRRELPKKVKDQAFKVTRQTMIKKLGLDLANKTIIDFTGADMCVKFNANKLTGGEFRKTVDFLKYHQFSFDGKGAYGRSVWCRNVATMRRKKKK